MPSNTPLGITYPAGSDPADVPLWMGDMAGDVDALITADRVRLTSLEANPHVLSGTFASRPAPAANARRFFYATDTDKLYYSNGTAWQITRMEGDVTMRFAWTYTLGGEIKVPSAATDFLPPVPIAVPTGQTVTVVGYNWGLGYGTSFTFSLQLAGSNLVTGIVATSAAGFGSGAITPTTAANQQQWQPIITAVNGTPSGGFVALVVDVTV